MPTLLVLGANTLVMLLTVLVVLWQLNNAYRETLDRAALTAQSLVEEKTNILLTQFEMLDRVMDRLTRKVRLADLSERHRLTLHEQFASEVGVFPFVSRFLLLDAEGYIRYESEQFEMNREQLPVCRPFPHVVEETVSSVIGRTETDAGRSPGCHPLAGVYYSRILRDHRGMPQYELVAMLRPETIGAGFFNEITWALGEKANYRIATRDGLFLIGFRNLPPGLSYTTDKDQGLGEHSMFSHVDGAGVRSHVAGFDLKVELVYSNDEILASGWRDTVARTVIAAAVFVASWFLLSWVIVRILRRHAAAMQEGELRFNRSLSYASVGAWEWDVAGNRMYWSDEIYKLTGIAKGVMEPSYDAFLAAVHPDDRQAVQAAVARSLEQQQEYEVVHRFIRPDDSICWVQERGGVRRDAQGIPLNMNGVAVDITGQYEAQRALAESESRFRAAFDSTAVGNVIISGQGIIVDANRAAENIFGYEVSELVGQSVGLLMPEPHRSRHKEYLRGYHETGQSAISRQGLDVQGVRKDGRYFPMRLAVGVMEVDGERSFIGSISDLSDIKNLEEQLRHSQKMDAIGQLAGGVAHDFNNVLGIAIGGLDLLKMKLAKQAVDDQLLDLLDRVHESLWRGAKMTQNLLDFSRQDQGGEVAAGLGELVQGSLELIRKSLTSSIRVEEALDAASWPVLVNPDDFQNALINLAINARDAMPQGGVLRLSSANITVEPDMAGGPQVLKPGDYVCFSVADTGVGMAPGVKEKVFEPFFSTKDRGKGTGLGLSMVYSFVKRAGGDITIQSEQGVGTTFHLYLPRATAALQPLVEEAGVARRDDGVIASGETVLIVDDEDMLAEVAREMFTSLGFTPLVCNSGVEALRTIELGELDLCLLFSDIVMPELDGVQLALAVRRLRPELPILLTSGYAQDVVVHSEDEAERLWCTELVGQRLPKPYDLQSLRERLRELLPDCGHVARRARS